MASRTRWAAAILVAGAGLACSAPSHAQSFGCSKMPSTVCQYLGWGYSAGHHVPIVHTPWLRPERTQRVAFSAASCGSLTPAPYIVYGCYDGHAAGAAVGCPGPGCAPGHVAAPTAGGTDVFAPPPVPASPTPAPAPLPAPAAESMAPSYRIAGR
jgi:hypothetical protein